MVEVGDKDFMNIRFEAWLAVFLAGESFKLSAEIFKDFLWVFKKQKMLVVSENSLIWIDASAFALKRKDNITDIIGITKSLMQESEHFLLHFKSRADEELYSPRRNDLIYILKHLYFNKTQENLPIYGLSTLNLKQFLTSERDQLRGITRIPS